MKKAKARKAKREPGVFRKIAYALYEDAKRRRALRILERQAWSLDFLSLALVRAGRYLGDNIALHIVNKDGARIELTYGSAKSNDIVQNLDTSIFMHLDDDLAVDRFIAENSRR